MISINGSLYLKEPCNIKNSSTSLDRCSD